MIGTILRAIGHRYVVRWKFPSKRVPGKTVDGSSKAMFKFEADYCAAWANASLSGEAWVEELPIRSHPDTPIADIRERAS